MAVGVSGAAGGAIAIPPMVLPITGVPWLDVTLTFWLIFGTATGLVARLEESHLFMPPRWWVVALKAAFWPLSPLIGWLTRREGR